LIRKILLKYLRLIKGHERKVIVITMAITFVLLVLLVVTIPIDVGHEPVFIEIEDGDGLNIIANKLKENGLIKNNFIFATYVRLIGGGKNLKAGKYTFSGRLNIVKISSILDRGLSSANDIRLLISEGFNIWEIDNRLVNLGLIVEGEFSSKYKDDEGYLFPDTYRINGEARGDDFIQELRQRMRDNFKNKTEELIGGLSSKEVEEIIIIASILEKEARTTEDMQLVSGIIQKRLSLDMPLQVDASVIYGACRRKAAESNFNKNCDVTLQGPAIEIKIDGIFNTYTRKGLPLAPISNPGIKSINATLNPAQSDYLYYLSTRDGSQMIYSKTAGEHVANRRKYLGI
jgi:UPF0755 protein